MQAEHPPGPTVHRGYSYPGLEKVYQVISDDIELGEKLRGVKDCKVGLLVHVILPWFLILQLELDEWRFLIR